MRSSVLQLGNTKKCKQEIHDVLCPVSGRREGGAINSMDVITAPSLLCYNTLLLCYNSIATILGPSLQYLAVLQCFVVLLCFTKLGYSL